MQAQHAISDNAQTHILAIYKNGQNIINNIKYKPRIKTESRIQKWIPSPKTVFTYVEEGHFVTNNLELVYFFPLK